MLATEGSENFETRASGCLRQTNPIGTRHMRGELESRHGRLMAQPYKALGPCPGQIIFDSFFKYADGQQRPVAHPTTTPRSSADYVLCTINIDIHAHLHVPFWGTSFCQPRTRGIIRPKAPFRPICDDFYRDNLNFALGRTSDSLYKIHGPLLLKIVTNRGGIWA